STPGASSSRAPASTPPTLAAAPRARRAATPPTGPRPRRRPPHPRPTDDPPSPRQRRALRSGHALARQAAVGALVRGCLPDRFGDLVRVASPATRAGREIGRAHV